jgi:spore coat protein H
MRTTLLLALLVPTLAVCGCGANNPGLANGAPDAGDGIDGTVAVATDDAPAAMADGEAPSGVVTDGGAAERAVKGPLPPLVEDRRIYDQQTDAILTIHLTGAAAALDAVNRDVAGAKAPVVFTADDYPAAGDVSNAVFSVHGTTTRLAIQKSFKIKLDVGTSSWRGQRIIVLNKHPYDLTRIRNRLSFEYFATIPNMTSARTQFAHLFVNGTDMGLYTQIEYVDADFLAAHGLDAAGTLYNIQGLAFTPIDDQAALDPVALGAMLTDRANPDLPRLRRMLTAVNDPKQNINAVIARYFNRDNYVTWLAMNALMGDYDTDSQNFMLYSPSGYEGWYLLPWDYDGAWGWNEQPTEPARPKWRSGLANWWSVILHQRFFQDPKNVADVTAMVDRLLATTLSDTKTTAIAARWHDVVKPFISIAPDLDNLPCDRAGTPDAIPQWETEYARIQATVSGMHGEYVTSLSTPMPVFLYEPIFGDPMVFSWGTSIELSGGPVSYDLLISRTRDFNPGDLVVQQTGLPQALTSVKRPAPGTYYWRIMIRDQSDPTNNWQQSFQDATVIVPAP